jgi:hypothetical protein
MIMNEHIVKGEKILTYRQPDGQWIAIPDRFADEDGPSEIADTEAEAIEACLELIVELDAANAARKARHAAAMEKREAA